MLRSCKTLTIAIALFALGSFSGCSIWPESDGSTPSESWTDRLRPQDELGPKATGLDPRARAIENNLGIN